MQDSRSVFFRLVVTVSFYISTGSRPFRFAPVAECSIPNLFHECNAPLSSAASYQS